MHSSGPRLSRPAPGSHSGGAGISTDDSLEKPSSPHAQSTEIGRSSLARSVGLSVLLALLCGGARLVVLRALPEGSWSADIYTWLATAQVMKSGGNPYNVSPFLDWPPLWMQVLFVLSHVSADSGLPLVRVIQLFLIVVEAILTAVAYLMLSRHWATDRAFLVVLVGLVLNPVAIILTTVHGNFDVIVGLFVLLFLWAVTSYHRIGRWDDWLLACLFLGLAILAKTTPLVLLPLLFLGIRQVSPRAIASGACLVLGPAALGMSVVLTLGLEQVVEHVLLYRSYSGVFGITGLFNLAGWPYPSWVGYTPAGGPVYSAAFGLFMVVAIGAVIYAGLVRDRSLREYDLVLIAGALLVVVPVLGPGYAPQYAWWWIAVLVLVFALGTTPARIVCAALYAVASATYIVEYGLVQGYGAVLLRWPHPAWFERMSLELTRPSADTVLRLPLFAAYLAFLVLAGWTVAWHAARRPASPVGD